MPEHCVLPGCLCSGPERRGPALGFSARLYVSSHDRSQKGFGSVSLYAFIISGLPGGALEIATRLSISDAQRDGPDAIMSSMGVASGTTGASVGGASR